MVESKEISKQKHIFSLDDGKSYLREFYLLDIGWVFISSLHYVPTTIVNWININRLEEC